jgi:hypothetical protein
VQNLDESAVFNDPIVDEYRRMHQLADPRQTGNRTPDIREAAKQISVIQKRDTKTLRSPWELDQE